jgi:leucyl aminopeptidase
MARTPQSLSVPGPVESVACDVLLTGAFTGEGGLELSSAAETVDRALDGYLKTLYEQGFTGESGEIVVVPTLGRVSARSLALVGLGAREALTPDVLRSATGNAIRRLTDRNEVASALHAGLADESAAVEASVEGLLLGSYRFEGYRSDPQPQKLQRLLYVDGGEAAIAQATARAGATLLARDLVNEPGSVITPSALARRAGETADVSGLGIEVMELDELKERGFGGIVSVGAGSGSAHPPCLVILRHRPEGATRKVSLVGKGITFDTGGYSIKPAQSMETMKTDMSGAATVLAVMGAIGTAGLPLEVTGYLACAENLVSETATRPGDVIHHFGGRTTEVNNTDAEGRLVLADALAFASEQEPDAVVDVATLTGTIHLALGNRLAGLFYNDESLRDEFEEAARRAGERVWRMPIVDEYGKTLESQVADSRASGSRYGGAMIAAFFLRKFVAPGIPWAHLDIAGSARADSDYDEVTKGGTGTMVRTLIRWLEARAIG